MNRRIWLIGGTQESAVLAQRLAEAGLSVVISVTTAAATGLYPHSDRLMVRVGALAASDMPDFVAAHGVEAILDASHPFATAISQLAIATATTHEIPYLRFERAMVEQPPTNPPNAASSVLTLPSVEALVSGAYLAPVQHQPQRVLLTLGYRVLPLFQPWQAHATLFARILPSAVALETALASGFTSGRLIALRPPIADDLERALWQQWRITTVVTKASGAAGGEARKRAIAQELGIRLILLARPVVDYPKQTGCVDEAIAWCKRQHVKIPAS